MIMFFIFSCHWALSVGRTSFQSTLFFQALEEKGASRRESEMGLMKYRSEMVSPLRQGTLQANGCEGEQGERNC